MAGKTVTLYIDDTSLRLMVTQGRQIKEWAVLPLDPGLVEKNIVIDEAEMVARVQQLLEVRKVKTKKIILGVSGLQCFTRPITLPKLPKEMLDEAVRREAQRALPVPLEELYISWQSIPSSEDKTQVFMVGIPCRMADSLLTVLQKAGLKPTLMDIKPLIFARMTKEAAAIIVDVQATEFDIVISVEGVPQPVRSISFPDESLSPEEKINTIRDELNRTLSFYNSNNPENELDSNVPIFASGELVNEPELCRTLSDEVGQPVLPLPSPLECPEGLDQGYYMVNICLASRKLSPASDAGTMVIRLNTLPPQYQPKPISITNILALPGGILAAASLIFLIWFIQTTTSNIATTSGQLNNTKQILQQRQSQQQEINASITGLDKEINEKGTLRDNLSAALVTLEEQTKGVNRELSITIGTLPTSIDLINISHITNVVTVTGNAPDENQVLAYITKLDNSGLFGDLTVVDITRVDDENLIFTMLGALQAQNLGVTSMEVVLGSLPVGINLTEVDSDEYALTVNGLTSDENLILIYLRTLEASRVFDDITIARMARTEGGEMEFSLILGIREK
ncbi:PilN domain-containing protein [Chloroflexota bacterium]